MFCGHYTSILGIEESVRNEKWVTADFLNFLIGQVVGVTLFGYEAYQFHADLFIWHQIIPVGSQPVNQTIRSSWSWKDNFLIDLFRHLNSL